MLFVDGEIDDFEAWRKSKMDILVVQIVKR